MKDYLAIASEFLVILNNLNIPHAVIGAVAVGVWSEERMTKDVDFTISMNESQWPKLKTQLEANPDAQIFQTSFDSGEKVPYLVRLKYKGVIIDLLASLTPYQDLLLERRVSTNIGGYTMDVASAEDVILLKLLAHRPQDLVDVEKIVGHIKNLDLAYIEQWAREWEVTKEWDKIKKGI